MELDRKTCYRALRTRDARFDGRFFTAVRTTGIFCRPVCPAPTPKLENCTFLPSAAAAGALGYRPCLRCRPEAAPGTPRWIGSPAVVSRSLRLIAEGALDENGAPELASRLGVGERHLRRLFLRHLGAAPGAVARTRRILFAKQLIDETLLPITEIAMASGFSSVRRFNDAIRQTYGRPPRALRKDTASTPAAGGLALRLAFRPPFDWNAMAAWLSARAIPGVESADAQGWRRTVHVDGHDGWIEVRPVAGKHHLEARLHLPEARGLLGAVERIRHVFDLDADPQSIAAAFVGDSRLGPLVARHPGLRVPGAWDGFELAVRAILGQQVTVKGATSLAGRLVRTFGTPLSPNGGERPAALAFRFPDAAALADADLRTIGIPARRAAAVSALARAVSGGSLALDGNADLDVTMSRLGALPGVGSWTVQYVAMRALREPDAFPADDLGLRIALADRNGLRPTARKIERLAEAWRPWRAYAAMHLWTKLAGGGTAARRAGREKR